MRLAFTAGLFVCAHAALANGPATDASPDGGLVQDAAFTRTFLPTPARVVPPPGPAAPGAAAEGAGPQFCFDAVDTGAAPEGDLPRELVYLPDGSGVAIVNRDTDNVAFFDPTTQTITDIVPVGDFPVNIAVSPDGQYVLTPNLLDNTVSIIDVATRTVAATVAVTGEQPYRIAVTADSQAAVVGVINNADDATFSVIDLNTFSEVRSFPGGVQGAIGFFGTPSFGIAGNIFTNFALAGDAQTIILPESVAGGGAVRLYDLTTGTQTAALPIAQGARGLDVADDGSIAAVTVSSPGNQLVIIDLLTQTVQNAFDLDHSSDGLIVLYPDNSTVAIAQSSNLFFYDVATGAQTSLVVSSFFGDLDITQDGQWIVGSNFNFRVFSAAAQSLVDTIPFEANAELAVSPTDNTVVSLNNRFRENVLVYNIDGANSSFIGFGQSGPPPEGDAPLEIRIAPDGSRAVVAHGVSANVAVIDLETLDVSHVATGDRVLDVAITPDSATAVACNGDSDSVSIIDLATATEVANIPLAGRPARVRIAPDGSMAYVLNIAGTDRMNFIELDGADSQIVAQVNTGQAGAWNGAAYTEPSGIELSPDGATLAVCDSFTDLLRLFDTATMSLVASVPTGDFPIRVAFSQDASRAYVANPFDDTLTVVNVAAGTQVANIGPVGDFTFNVVVDDAGFVYVGDYNFAAGGSLFVINAGANAVVATIDLPGTQRIRNMVYDAGTNIIYAATTPGANDDPALLRFDANGPLTTLIDATPISGSPNGLDFNPNQETVAIAQTGLDLADIAAFDCNAGPPPTCPGDFDFDGDVDSTDLNTLLAVFGQNVPPGDPGDTNNDGVVDSTDLNTLLADFGGVCP